MKNLMREQSVENLQKNKIKSKYLKKMSYVSITIDLISFTTMEIFKFIYQDECLFPNEFSYFIGKVLIIMSLSAIMFYSINKRKIKTLLVSCIIYLILGLLMFVYLIVKEIKNSNEDDHSQPARDLIYYQLIIYLIIGLDIISGVFRFLGCIFMITLVKVLYKIKIIEETLRTNDGVFLYTRKSLTNSLIDTKNTSSNNNINNNFYFNNCPEGQRFNINHSFISTKDNPNDFETFNFNNRNSFMRISIKNDNYIKQSVVEKETKSNSTNPQERHKNKSENNICNNESNSKFFGFSFLNTKPNDFPSNKSFVNFPIVENKHMNVLNHDPEVNINDAINIEYLQSLMINRERYNTENQYPNNFANTYDSNYDNSVFIETPKDRNRILD